MRPNGLILSKGGRAMGSFDEVAAAVLFVLVFWCTITIAVFYHTGVY